MAYRRSRRSTPRRSSYSRPRRSYRRSTVARRRTRRTSGRNTLRIVIEQPQSSAVARPLGVKAAPAPKKSKF